MIVPAHLRLLTLAEYRARRAAAPRIEPAQAPATKRAFSIGNRVGPKRADFEFYPTPPEATRALLSVESFEGDIWEPACGQGHISKVLEAHGCPVVSTDLADWGYGLTGQDFLAERTPLARNIVTNRRVRASCAATCVRDPWQGGHVGCDPKLGAPLRHSLWTNHPPAALYILDECQCWPYGDPKRATTAIGKQRYCWVVWNAAQAGPTVVRWLTTRPFRTAV